MEHNDTIDTMKEMAGRMLEKFGVTVMLKEALRKEPVIYIARMDGTVEVRGKGNLY